MEMVTKHWFNVMQNLFVMVETHLVELCNLQWTNARTVNPMMVVMMLKVSHASQLTIIRPD